VVFVKYPFEKKEYKFLIKTLVFSAILITILGLAQYIFEFDLNLNGLDKYPDIRGRIPSTFFNPIYLGVYINIVFIYLLTFMREKLLNRKVVYVLLIGLYTILVLTFTRSAILVFCGILFLTLIFNYKLILNKLTTSLLILCVAITLLIPGAKNVNLNSFENGFNMIFKSDFMSAVTFGLFDGVNSGSEQLETFEDASLEHRKQFALIAKKIAKDNPLTGVGFGTYMDYMDSEQFAETYPDYTYPHTHPHSGFVLLAAETGYISTVLFVLSIAILALYLLKEFIIRLKTRDLEYKLSLCILCVSAGFVITCIIAENLFYDTQIFPTYLFVIMLTYNFICSTAKKAK
jgi:O-antigen ligase